MFGQIIGYVSVRFLCVGPPVMDANNSIPLETRNVLIGAPITLSCSAGGDGLVWLWYHSGMIMEVSSNTLVVPSSTLADSGIYQCFAYNSASYASATGNISVYGQFRLVSNVYLYLHPKWGNVLK